MSEEGVLLHVKVRLHMLDQIGELLTSSDDTATIFANLVQLLVPSVADACAVLQQADDGTWEEHATAHTDVEQAVAWANMGLDFLGMGNRLGGWNMETDGVEPQLYAPSAVEPWVDRVISAEQQRLLAVYAPRSACSIPISLRGRTYGVLALMMTTSKRRYTAADLQYLQKLVRPVALFADHAFLTGAARHAHDVSDRAVRRTTQLQAVAAAMGSALTRQEVGTNLVRFCVAAVGAASALLVVCSDDGSELELLSSAGYDAAIVARWARFPADTPMPIADAARSGQPVWLATPADMEAAYPIFRGRGSPRIHQALGSIPLVTEGRSIGAIGLAFDEPQQWDDQDQALVFAMAQLCAQALERARLYDAERQARIEAEQEIARRKSAEAALMRSEEQLRLLTDALPVLIAYVDREQRYQFNNKTYEDWFGYERAEIVGKHIRDVVGPKTYASVRPFVERGLAGEQFTDEALLPFKDGSVRPVEGTYIPHVSADGEVLGYYALFSDISERKRAETSQRFLTEATSLLASSLDYETTLAHIGELAVPAIADWCSINLVNEQGVFARVTGVHVDPRKQMLLDDLREREPPSLNNDSAAARALRSGEPLLIPEFTDATYRALATSEAQYQVYQRVGMKSAMLLPLRSSNRLLGSLILIISEGDRRYTKDDLEFAQNVANRAAVAIENARLFRQIQETVRIREEFLSIAAHELKTPITALSGYAQLLASRFVLDYTVKERDLRAIEVINAQVERLVKLIGAMLDVSRIESGQFALDISAVNLSELVATAVDELGPTLALHSIDYTGVVPGIVINGDAQRLEQAILNLLQNAIKYSPGGGAITVTLRRDTDWAVLAVADEGIGIPSTALGSLFQLFYRASNVAETSISGVGLGLYVVQEIVSRHGGNIEVVSEEGRGSTFFIRLPAQ